MLVVKLNLFFLKRAKSLIREGNSVPLYLDHKESQCFNQFKQNWTSLHEKRQNPDFVWHIFFRLSSESYPYFPVYGHNLRYKGKYRYDSVHMRENRDQRKPVFRHTSPSAYCCSYVSFNLTLLNWVMYIGIFYCDSLLLLGFDFFPFKIYSLPPLQKM